MFTMSTARSKPRALLLMTLFAAALTSCRGQTEVYYVRGTRMREEEAGFMRLAERTSRVNPHRSAAVAEVEAAGYYVLHPDDLAAFVRAADRLRRSEAAGRILTEAEAEAARKAER